MNKRIAFLIAGSLGLGSVPAFAADDLEPLARAVAEHPDDGEALNKYAGALLGKGRVDEAIVALKRGVARMNEFPRGYYLLAYAYRKKADLLKGATGANVQLNVQNAYYDAADFYRAYIVLKPKETDTYFGLGMSLAGAGEKPAAIAALKKYVSDEKRPERQKFVEQAKGEIAALEPPAAAPGAGSPEAQSLRAEADKLRTERKFDEAVAAYKRAIDADKGNPDLWNNQGNCYYSLATAATKDNKTAEAMKNYNASADSFKQAATLDPKFADAWFNLAHALRKADRKQEAVEAYKRYMKLKPEDADPYFGLGQTLKQLGDVPGSIAAYKKYVEMEKDPSKLKFVEKARAELQALEAMQKPAAPAGAPASGGRISDEP